MKRNDYLIMIVFGFCSCHKEGTQTNASLPEVDVVQATGEVGEIILIAEKFLKE